MRDDRFLPAPDAPSCPASSRTESFDRAVSRALPSLLRAARRAGLTTDTTHEIVQATCLAAIERSATFDPRRSLHAWLLGILRNHLRRLFHGCRKPCGKALEDCTSPDRSPSSSCAEHEHESGLRRAIAGLPAPYRDVLVSYLRGNTRPTDIAADVGRSASTVRTQLQRGIERLRTQLAMPMACAPSAGTCRARPGASRPGGARRNGPARAGQRIATTAGLDRTSRDVAR